MTTPPDDRNPLGFHSQSGNQGGERPPIPLVDRGDRHCPKCGASVTPGQAVCTECGARLQRTPTTIRCRYCGKRASSELVICPHCGRELRPAPSRLLTWVLPGLVVAAFAAGIIWGNPLAWVQGDGGSDQTQQQAQEQAQAMAENVVITPIPGDGQGSEPPATPLPPQPTATSPVTPTEAAVAVAPTATSTDTPASTDTPTSAPTSTPTELPTETATEAPTETPTATNTPTSAPTETSTRTPTRKPTATRAATKVATKAATSTPTREPTATPTRRSTDTPTPAPTATPTRTRTPTRRPTATPTRQPTSTPIPASTGGQNSAASLNYTVQAGDTPVGIAERFGITVDQLLRANGLTREDATKIRPGQVLIIPRESGSGEIRVTYTVRPGDTIVGIAKRFGVTVEEMLQANGLTSQEAKELQVGRVLNVPVGGSQTATRATATRAPTATATVAPQRYTVRPGDTFVGIARRFRVNVENLMAANGMTNAEARLIRPGQVLVIPAPGQIYPTPTPKVTPSPTPATQVYTVRPGDTLLGIARRFKVRADDIMAANDMTPEEARLIRPGQKLIIPAPGQPVSTPEAKGTPGADEASYRLDAPVVVDPNPGVNVTCSASNIYFVLWEEVPGMAPDDEYVLFLGYLNGPPATRDDEEEEIVWVLEQRQGQRNSWKMDANLCNLAPQEYGRQWRLYVQVFDGETPVSPPSELRKFSWR